MKFKVDCENFKDFIKFLWVFKTFEFLKWTEKNQKV